MHPSDMCEHKKAYALCKECIERDFAAKQARDALPRTVSIMSGAPGSGKTTAVRKVLDEAANDIFRGVSGLQYGTVAACSADDYFMRDGEYKFDVKELGAAHAACFKQFIGFLQTGITHVFVHNTSIEAWEISPYMLASAAFGYDATIHTLTVDPDVAFERNVHGVPLKTIQRMCDRIKNRRLPGYWKEVKVA